MKIIKTIVLLSILLISGTAFADSKLLLNGVDVTGASGEIAFDSKVSTNHTVQCYYTDANASISALVLELQGSISPKSDATAKWFTIAEHTFVGAEITAKQAIFFTTSAAISRVRVNITTLTGEQVGTDKVYVSYNQGDN